MPNHVPTQFHNTRGCPKLLYTVYELNVLPYPLYTHACLQKVLEQPGKQFSALKPVVQPDFVFAFSVGKLLSIKFVYMCTVAASMSLTVSS